MALKIDSEYHPIPDFLRNPKFRLIPYIIPHTSILKAGESRLYSSPENIVITATGLIEGGMWGSRKIEKGEVYLVDKNGNEPQPYEHINYPDVGYRIIGY